MSIVMSRDGLACALLRGLAEWSVQMNQRAKLFCLLIVSLSVGVLASSAGQGSGHVIRWGPGHCPPDDNPQFFVPSTFGSNPAFLARCYSWYLRSMQEQPLLGPSADGRLGLYRVLVLPAYSSPVVARLTVAGDGTAELSSKVGKSDITPEVVVINETRQVAREDVNAFVRLLDIAGFWSTQSVQEDPRHHVFGGTCWLLEGSLAGTYHVTSWVEPRRVACSDAAAFLVWNLGKVDLHRLPTQPPAR